MPSIDWSVPVGSTIVNILGYLVTVGGAAIGAIIYMRRDVTETQKAIINVNKAVEELTDLMNRHEKEDQLRFNSVRDELDSVRDSFGENCAAIRQKIHDFEVWCRDAFIRRESFREVMVDQKERMERIERKLDNIAEINK